MGIPSWDHREVEAKWQRVWRQTKLNSPDISAAKKPFYNLMMFPYSSAEGLHVGNMYAFTGSDIYGRFKRMQGYDVFEPIGLDGFGIHSENHALKTGKHPMDHASVTQKKFYAQLHKIGAMFDWDRTLQTYDPDYYRWTQWIFIQMFKHGLAYRGRATVNWCPSDKTVLADEQVVDNTCERCGNIVEKRLLEQWFFRITEYAGKLLENLPSLDWSEKVKVAQTNWIGKKEGINITYDVVDENNNKIGEVICFTTRPDTNFGATFVVLAPEHSFISQLLLVIKKEERVKLTTYIEAAKAKSESERASEGQIKTGVFTHLSCINQLTGRRMPLYVSDFVLMNVGTGAVVGVPGHDKRDFAFAIQFDIPIIRVVKGEDGDTSDISRAEHVQEVASPATRRGGGTMMNSKFLDGLDIHEATKKMMDYLENKGWGKRVTTYHLRDWLPCRQRYWGPPTPMIFCNKCAKEGKSWFTTKEARVMPGPARNASYSDAGGWYPVPEDELPVLLPRIADYKPGDDGVAPLAKHKEFYETTCPGCKGRGVRETDVLDTFVDSSWYFLRYPSVHRDSSESSFLRAPKGDASPPAGEAGRSESAVSGQLPWDPAITKKWLPVDMYTGGAEHSVLHLLYSRFVTMALKDWGYLTFEEPFSKFYAHGLVIKDGAKMSKSKGNIVTPDEYIRLYGCDALRLYLMFMGPFDQGGDFRDSGMEGMSRWVRRVWRMAQTSIMNRSKSSSATIISALQKVIERVGDDIEKRRYNTAIAGMMEFTNLVSDQGGIMGLDDLKKFILILAPFAPHLTEELWFRCCNSASRILDPPAGGSGDQLGGTYSVHTQPWPSYDPTKIIEKTVQVVIQVNGKLRDALTVTKEQGMSQKDIEASAKKSKKVQKFLAGKAIRKVIFIPGKLINFVIE
jgi:leucyl-tRNA synthetase